MERLTFDSEGNIATIDSAQIKKKTRTPTQYSKPLNKNLKTSQSLSFLKEETPSISASEIFDNPYWSFYNEKNQPIPEFPIKTYDDEFFLID